MQTARRLFPRKEVVVLFVFVSLAGCVSPRKGPSYFHPDAGLQEPISLLEKAREIEKEDFENIRLVTLAQTGFSSHHLVVVRKGEPLHTHARHDGWALVLKGKGEFLLGEKKFPIRPGASFYIPRGVQHKATRQGKESLAAFVIFTPPYDGKDTIAVKE